MSEEDKLEQEAVIHGRDAWQRLKKDQTFEDWLLVGQALEIGRSFARRGFGVELVDRPALVVGQCHDELGVGRLKIIGLEELDREVGLDEQDDGRLGFRPRITDKVGRQPIIDRLAPISPVRRRL